MSGRRMDNQTKSSDFDRSIDPFEPSLHQEQKLRGFSKVFNTNQAKPVNCSLASQFKMSKASFSKSEENKIKLISSP